MRPRTARPENEISALIADIRNRGILSQSKIAELLGVSLVSVSKWERGIAKPSEKQQRQIMGLHTAVLDGKQSSNGGDGAAFASRGVRTRMPGQAVLGEPLYRITLTQDIQIPLISRLMHGRIFAKKGELELSNILADHREAAATPEQPSSIQVSAGKNTYTYDAHTYHTKVPPQGIAELMRYYLPGGGLVLDPFAGSGMTGVAARVLGYDCILNELSPAACFIADRFISRDIKATEFEAAIEAILNELAAIRKSLYTTLCRECGRETELLYTVWAYRVICTSCAGEFQMWDVCRKYGRVVREHKILTEFNCPLCAHRLRKASLSRIRSEPVMIGYKCCGSKQQEVTHPPTNDDLARIDAINDRPPLAYGFFPTANLPDGVNLRQPAKHGLTTIDKFYTVRNLSALSHIWKTIHRIESPNLAAQAGFVFTSLYQRVTRLSEFRFWGGSGNTAHFNVPFIWNEANVFVTFERKARTIQDHLSSTAASYKGRSLVVNGSATCLSQLPASSIDLVFTDPPFGANINYSEMNFLWESWLGEFTDNTHEAIVNRVQGKGVQQYQELMTQSLRECFRVLRPGHWLLLVFMNSSKEIWQALRMAIGQAGFSIRNIDMFDKQHGTFKQFVSENTAGMDLVLHCQKPVSPELVSHVGASQRTTASVIDFLRQRESMPTNIYLHVGRADEVDFRTLYSEWLAQSLVGSAELLDFGAFRAIVQQWLKKEGFA